MTPKPQGTDLKLDFIRVKHVYVKGHHQERHTHRNYLQMSGDLHLEYVKNSDNNKTTPLKGQRT